jgi:hypothetical protein
VAWIGNPSTFAASTAYTATITLTPKTGYTLYGVIQNFFTVDKATAVNNTANTGVITAVFPATANTVIINITVEQIEDGTPDIKPPEGVELKISISGSNGIPTSLTLNAPAGYFNYEWTIEGVGNDELITLATGSSASTATVVTDNPRYNSVGKHAVYLVVYKTNGGAPYSKTIFIEIVE